ncbi:adenylosuccinate lyase [Buchnera aphidicola str. APS (Acyrthosiphon pisum)]|uniref:Adenylosuccinate lyase n=2 Tax=Buchnera aphidicola TaxID=9 RepID=PUR8_BUCAI|nr:adenylosuccinate lyase [Buchnera aphidicola]P57351.1 RecName: Full=Adenylosuccinate lyase; Short=ASL; AltName: Full=Adenylosuccinase; Short=ASase [Buchnera aphidicola str. APS (Acyrthosiphon pisum)]pir/E84960/ adenylosuccinate lyase (EC 4.3.2.2) [imported] - Buchnera sp. (strain APS) [Buchnera sp. (in: enterobacteria)]OQX99755.1 MAG: adenylosuccinate lyase [Erwiniaceae bacterium 4572_131]ACL30627.1 adenylosuccinate lyase [Buchnera aphidicola str. 5A (Acyrthosiphon pisum)]BAB12973.1 adenylos
MELTSLTAISPVDGRYSNLTILLRNIFSEFGFLKYRLNIEVQWLKKIISMSQILDINNIEYKEILFLDSIVEEFNEKDAILIKNIEKETNHDIKALEYFLKNKIAQSKNLLTISEFVHFGCTSEDINNIAYSLMIKDARDKIILPLWYKIISTLKKMVFKYQHYPLLSLTHGQPATPSTMGKEIANFYYRMKRQYIILKKIEILGKINGSTGNYNAHLAAYPDINWHKISKDFITSFGINWNPYTTQIEPHDYIAEFFSCMSLFNTILINFNRDMWGYISLNYFKQRTIDYEIGSSIMPHKVNPIDFENSEGNLGLSNALMNHMITKLPISRWQRDLSDSTVLRNIGVAISYAIIAYNSVLSGINKLEINESELLKNLDKNWSILSEPIQTIMRRYGIKNAYEKLKKLTRGKEINRNVIHTFISSLNIPEEEKKRLKNMTPFNYIGAASQIINEIE